MSSTLTPVDISNMPDLLDLVEEVEATKKPRALMRDNKPVALLTPIVKHKEKWKKIKATFGRWSDLDPDKLIAEIHRSREEGVTFSRANMIGDAGHLSGTFQQRHGPLRRSPGLHPCHKLQQGSADVVRAIRHDIGPQEARVIR